VTGSRRRIVRSAAGSPTGINVNCSKEAEKTTEA